MMKENEAAKPGSNKNAHNSQGTRHSSRLQDNGTVMSKTTMSNKATCMPQGNLNSSPSNSMSSCSLETISRVCGISLGKDENERLANISLIQAREEAMEALVKAKTKIQLSSDQAEKHESRDMNVINGTDVIEIDTTQSFGQAREGPTMDNNLSQNHPK